MSNSRRIYDVIHIKATNKWEVQFRELAPSGHSPTETLVERMFKISAMFIARALARRSWFKYNTPSQVLIRTRDGRIKREWSYGCDSEAKG